MLAHVLDALGGAGAERLAVVIGPDRDDVAREVGTVAPDAAVFTQNDRLGTAHAVLSARPALEEGADDVVVAFADTPLMTAETFRRLRAPLAEGAAVAVLGFEAEDPTGYGRLHHARRAAHGHPRASRRERSRAGRHASATAA